MSLHILLDQVLMMNTSLNYEGMAVYLFGISCWKVLYSFVFFCCLKTPLQWICRKKVLLYLQMQIFLNWKHVAFAIIYYSQIFHTRWILFWRHSFSAAFMALFWRFLLLIIFLWINRKEMSPFRINLFLAWKAIQSVKFRSLYVTVLCYHPVVENSLLAWIIQVI